MIKGSVRVNDAEYRQGIARLESLKQFATKELLREVARRLALELGDIDPFKYPPQTNAPMADLWTDKQRRYFFAALRDGRIQVPYKRTNTLKNSIEYRVTFQGDQTVTISGVIPDGSKASRYAKYVVGREQSRYFRQRTHWKPLEEMVKDRKDDFTAAAVLILDEIAREYESTL